MASPPPAATRIRSVDIRGTAFHVTLATGKTLEGRELAGATISLALFGEPRPRRVWLAQIIDDPMDRQGDVLLYDMRVLDRATGTSAPLCEDAVESGCSAVAVGWACLFPPLSSGGALVAQP
jgi:hypothetical protein